MKFFNDFIGEDCANEVVEFCSRTEEENFIEKLKTQPDDWYYRTAKIDYKFNSYGHRCKDISELNWNNYILFTGCSHSQGVGLELEKTYPYLVAQKDVCDYYNLGVSATGIDVVEYNLSLWFFKYSKKPKAVIIQWPDHSRFVSQYPGYDHLIPNGSWTTDDFSKKMLVAGEDSGFFNARKYLNYLSIHNVIDVPILQYNFGAQATYDHYEKVFKKIDLARDFLHFGVKTHEAIADNIYEDMQTAVNN